MEISPDPHVALDSPSGAQTEVSVQWFEYHGWPDCCRIANRSAEAIVVPAIGRIMQFRLHGDPLGTLWENRALDGQLHSSCCGKWMNFGGEKCWPAPQSGWPRQQGYDWPPPAAFDAQPMQATVASSGIALTSPPDPAYGIQIRRRIELDPTQPVLRIQTEFSKIHGSASAVGVWAIAQMQDPQRIYVPLPEKSKFPRGYVSLLEGQPAKLKIDGRLLSLARHPRNCTKIGADAASLVWMGANCALRIDTERKPGIYPDGGCVTEIYTNPSPGNYVELESMGPLATMNSGDRLEQATSYTLLPRTTSDADAEAERVLRGSLRR